MRERSKIVIDRRPVTQHVQHFCVMSRKNSRGVNFSKRGSRRILPPPVIYLHCRDWSCSLRVFKVINMSASALTQNLDRLRYSCLTIKPLKRRLSQNTLYYLTIILTLLGFLGISSVSFLSPRSGQLVPKKQRKLIMVSDKHRTPHSFDDTVSFLLS